jgi:hypothetical protein
MFTLETGKTVRAKSHDADDCIAICKGIPGSCVRSVVTDEVIWIYGIGMTVKRSKWESEQ